MNQHTMENSRKKKVVLVVDDDSTLRGALNDDLTQEGFEVLMAASGEEGLVLTLRERPDLILLDLLMPGMGGIEMVKRLREDAWGKSAKVLILSNVGDLKRVSRALEEEVFDYFVKADTPLRELVRKIREMTKNR